MNVQRGKMVSGGRLLVPAEFRRTLGLSDGDPLIMEIVGDELRVRSFGANLKRVQERLKKYKPEGYNLSDELIADRRRESELE
jgi:antitoxin PrlF